MKVALGQFAVKREWQENADICLGLMDQAHQQGARLLVLPEAVSARDIADPEWGIKAAQSVDGPFLRLLLAGSLSDTLTTVFTVHVPDGDGRVVNALVVIRQGRIIARYDKLHLYDAFTLQERAA